MDTFPTVSVIIATDGRQKSLAATLAALRYLRYPRFEVVVVAGPTPDGTREMLEGWKDKVKIGYCPERNACMSRNIGTGISSGEILAFLDDDALPEPEWLDDLIAPFADPRVGVTGGFVLDHFGKRVQWAYETADRFGTADLSWGRPTPEFNFPLSFNFPYVAMVNGAFRRSAVMEVGGIDEEYGYYLEDTDLICRMVDRGWTVAQVNRAFVHHKYLSNEIRDDRQVERSWYTLIKNKAYFALVNGGNCVSLARILHEIDDWVQMWRERVKVRIAEGALFPEDAERFEREADQALRRALDRGLRGTRQLAAPERLRGAPENFLPFQAVLPAGQQRCFVFVSAFIYPPTPVNGIARYVQQLARGMAARGHQVHVLTCAEQRDRVDFEDGVWVHRSSVRDLPPAATAGGPLPRERWNHSRAMLAEAKEIAVRRPVDCVHAPISDGEAIAFLRDGSFPLITSLHTTFSSFPEDEDETTWVRPMLAAERELLTRSDGILANSRFSVAAFEKAHGLSLDPDRLCIVPHGIEDTRDLSAEMPEPIPAEMTRLVFIGRLEPRKGIDVLLPLVPDLLARHPRVCFDFVGNDRIPAPGGGTWRAALEAALAPAARPRVAFHGALPDPRLRGFYRAADIVIAPSRFESFGLVHVEAMMHGKPVIGCRAGATPELIEDGRTGLLAEPGDAASLQACIERLLADPGLRRRLGEAARAEFLDRFTRERMAAAEEEFLLRIAGRRPPPSAAKPAPMLAAPGRCGGGEVSRKRAAKPRIAIIAEQLTPSDAVATAVFDTWRFLAEDPEWDVCVLTAKNELPDLPAKVVGGLGDMLLSPEFLSAELLIYHYSFVSDLCNALLLGNGSAMQAVFFHGITPPELAVPRNRHSTARSFVQLHNLRRADRLWPVSGTNAEFLREARFDPARIDIIPLSVDRPPISRLTDKVAAPIELLFLGRIVPHKGVHELIEAIARIRPRRLPPFRLRIGGLVDYYAEDYFAALQRAIAKHDLGDIVEFIGLLDETRRDRLLRAAHVLPIPSYHEGFCKPVIEALRAGCVPVGYASHNLRFIGDGLCRLVAPGDVAGFADALAEAIADTAAAIADPGARLRLDRGSLTAVEFTAAALAHVEQFQPQRIAPVMRRHVARLLSSRPDQPAPAVLAAAGS